MMNNLGVGGAEKALVSMLQVFDFSRYEVDLLLFKQEGLFLKQLPEEVTLLPEPENWKYFDMPFSQVVKENFFRGKWNVIIQRIIFKLVQIKAKNTSEKEQFGWNAVAKTMISLSKKYDVAIGFLQNNPNYFVVDKVNADKKIGYIHTNYEALKIDTKFDQKYFEYLDKVITVSDDSREVLNKLFPYMKQKFAVIKNISSQKTIRDLALAAIDDEAFQNSILTVGRLTKVKNHQLAIDAFEILNKRNIPFFWYVLGDGVLRSQLEESVKRAGLIDRVFFLGAKENPYPYILKSEIFLLTSLFEGDGIVVREAKILNKPIILTNFNTASAHVESNVNGIIVKCNAEELADSIEDLIVNYDKRMAFSKELSKSNWGTENEIEKLYQLIED